MGLNSFKRYTSSILFFLFIFYSIHNNSQAQEKKTISSVQEAIALSLKNNSAIVTAYLNQMQTEEQVSEVYSENLIPSLKLNSRFTRTFKSQVFYIAGQQIQVGSDNGLTNTIDLTQSLPILGTPIFSGIRIAEYFNEVQVENINLAENDVKADVKKNYYTVLLAKSVVEVNRLTLENAQENFNVVDARYRNGAATEFDYLRAKVRVDNSLPDLSKSERNFDISRKALINAIGLKDVQDIEVTGELTYDSTEVWGNTNEMINKISENYVTLRQLRITKKINEELLNVSKANYLPKISVFGQYVLGSGENDGRPISDYRFYNTANAGLALSWDLNLFRNSFKVNQSEIQIKKSNEEIADTKQKLKLLSQSAIIVLEDAKERIISQVKTVSLAERSVELANASYRAGVINLIDVQAAELSLSQTRLAYLQAIYDYQTAKAELERLLEK
ncbi:MAG: TolC family protein [Ignavibacteria bacterium]